LLSVPALTRDRILRAAIQLADREGPDSITLRRIAAELGVHVTSLYHHVPTRDAVTDGIVELLLEEAKLPLHEVAWETWVRAFFDAIGTISATHPGAFFALQHRPVQGARASASFEVALAAFTRAGFSPLDAYAAVKTVSWLALAIGVENGMRSRGDMSETNIDELPADAFPILRSIAPVTTPEEPWAFGVETIIDGLRAQLDRRSTAGG